MTATEHTEAYLPKFEHDIFMSYRHVADPDPWIDALHDCLRKELKAYLDRIDIWRDRPALRAGDRWHDEIEAALSSAAVFLAVVTQTYLNSEVCVHELDLYLQRCRSNTQNAIEGIVIPVLRHRFDEPPGDLKAFQAVKFFDSASGRELNPRRAEDPDSGFYLAVAELAQDLKRRLEAIAGVLRQGMTPVFLASTGYGDDGRRQALRRELLQRDFLVLPEAPYLWSSQTLEQRIHADLDRAALCVHIVPAGADATRREQVRRQLELATAVMKAKRQPLPLVWLPARAAGETQGDELVEYIRNELADQGVEYHEGDSIEQFKTLVDDKLAEILRGTPAPRAAQAAKVALLVAPDDIGASGVLTTLLCDRLDRDYLRLPAAGAGALADSAAALAACSAVIVVWGRSGEAWVHGLLDAEALAAWRARGALAVCMAAPASDEKATFGARRVTRLHAGGADFEPGLHDFLASAERRP